MRTIRHRPALALVPDLGPHAGGARLADVLRLLRRLVQQRGPPSIVGPVPLDLAGGLQPGWGALPNRATL